MREPSFNPSLNVLEAKRHKSEAFDYEHRHFSAEDLEEIAAVH